jgi:hypothetical protein
VPLTDFQRVILALLARNRTPESYLAGGAALHFRPNSTRYSQDLDFFHDSAERVAAAYAQDAALLAEAGHAVQLEISQPGFIRAIVRRDAEGGRPRPEEIARLHLAVPFDLAAAKATWLAALDEADAFARSRPADEAGCLYRSDRRERFVLPRADLTLESQGVRMHFGRPGGVLPRAVDA